MLSLFIRERPFILISAPPLILSAPLLYPSFSVLILVVSYVNCGSPFHPIREFVPWYPRIIIDLDSGELQHAACCSIPTPNQVCPKQSSSRADVIQTKSEDSVSKLKQKLMQQS
jgi:hypothetical protein